MTAPAVRLGLRENAAQFSLLVLVNLFVGSMVGLERSTLPLIGRSDFGLGSSAAVLSFIVAFGVAKSVTNLGAGLQPIALAAALTNRFSPDTEFFFRLVATNSAGRSESAVQTVRIPWFVAQGAALPQLNYGAAAWGDFDNDGDLDLVVAGAGSTRLFRNEAAGWIEVSASLPGVTEGTVTWGDFNADGRLDLLVCGAGHASIQRGDGNGGFTPHASCPDPGFAATGAVGDFDNDGDLDVVVIGTSYGKLFRNNGGGVFTDAGETLPTYSGGVAVADFDRDGNLDIAFTGGATLVLHNDGTGHFTAVVAGLPALSSSRVAVADFDNDGWPDLALTGTPGGPSVTRVFRNATSGGALAFVEIPATLFGTTEGALVAADFDQDGWADLAVSGASGAGAWGSAIYRNLAGAGFSDAVTSGLPAAFCC